MPRQPINRAPEHVDMTPLHPSTAPPRRRRIIYLVPNLLTALGFLCGFFSLISSIRGDFPAAVIAIFLAAFFDNIDGRFARMTNTSSDFGAHYDSLSDLLCFGVAPALLYYQWAFVNPPTEVAGRFGWAVAFLYASCTALRLARFNVPSEKSDKRFFVGLPCPVAATFIASIQWMTARQDLPVELWFWLALGAMFTIALLMVSNIPYFSFKTLSFGPRIPFSGLILVVGAIALALFDPYLCVFVALALYSFHGFVLSGWKMLRRRSSRGRSVSKPKAPA